MNLKDKISEDLKSAMKARKMEHVSILRVLKGDIERAEQTSNGKVELTNGDIVKLIKKTIDGINETTKNKTEIDVLTEYLPKQLTEENIRNLVSEIKDMGKDNMGDIMKFFKANYDGRYDGKLVSNIAKEVLA